MGARMKFHLKQSNFNNMKELIEEQMKKIILGYCQGINHLEFDLKDLDKMVDELKEAVENEIDFVCN